MRDESVSLVLGGRMSGERSAAAMDADADLVARFLSGDQRAFDTLFARYQDYVYNIVYGIVGSAEEARDVTQDVFVQVYRRLSGFRRGSRFATWLYRVAVNRAVDAARSAKGRKWLPLLDQFLQIPDPADSPEKEAIHQSERSAVQATLMKVPVQHRDILVLRYYQGLSIDEIAEVLGCSVAAAKVRLHRARGHFKEHYVAQIGTDNS